MPVGPQTPTHLLAREPRSAQSNPDAVPYLYEREGTICENLAKAPACLKKVRQGILERTSEGVEAVRT